MKEELASDTALFAAGALNIAGIAKAMLCSADLREQEL